MNVIDNFDTGSCTLPGINGRSGGWYAFDDGKSKLDGGADALSMNCSAQVSGGAPGSSFALELSSPLGFVNYAGAGTDLNNPGTKAVYDLSSYTGVAFWAKGNSALDVRFQVADGSSWGTQISITSNWQQYTVRLSNLEIMYSTSEAGSFQPNEAETLQFGILSNQPFDVYIQDIGLY